MPPASSPGSGCRRRRRREVAFLVTNAGLFRAAVRRNEPLDEHEIYEMASHVRTAERARGAVPPHHRHRRSVDVAAQGDWTSSTRWSSKVWPIRRSPAPRPARSPRPGSRRPNGCAENPVTRERHRPCAAAVPAGPRTRRVGPTGAARRTPAPAGTVRVAVSPNGRARPLEGRRRLPRPHGAPRPTSRRGWRTPDSTSHRRRIATWGDGAVLDSFTVSTRRSGRAHESSPRPWKPRSARR